MTPAEELTQAADKLDALTANTSIAPWREPYEGFTPDDGGWWVHNGGTGMKEHAVAVTLPYSPNAEADARYIAAMNPLVGKALAKYLRGAGHRLSSRSPDYQAVVAERGVLFDAYYGHALGIARLINGSAA